ncbi:MAG: TetR/AcrR family transcriptional regulator [Acidobacteriales bacterium]|nr:TetR/AcrR family transcriptional regulator [Terriglobales bacterium]
MPTRLPASERKAQILRTATELFSQQGYEGTKTSLIAREAGVNEAIIFRHFTSKEELYWAVLEASCCANDLNVQLKDSLDFTREPEEVLYQLAVDILTRIAASPHMMRLLLFAALENHKLSHRFFRQYASIKYEELASYIRTRIRQGDFRSDVDPLLAARAFLGMLIYHNQIQQLFGGKQVHDYEIKHVAENFVRLWLGGVRPETSSERTVPTEPKTRRAKPSLAAAM